MIDPVVSAVNVYLAFTSALPYAITALVNLALILYVLPALLRALWKDLR